MAEVAVAKLPAHLNPDCHFKPGQSGNPAGRPKGARSKLGEDFLRALSEDFAEHGIAALVKVRETKPADYLKVVASLMPKEIDASDRMIDALGELLDRVDGKTRTIAPAVIEPLRLAG